MKHNIISTCMHLKENLTNFTSLKFLNTFAATSFFCKFFFLQYFICRKEKNLESGSKPFLCQFFFQHNLKLNYFLSFNNVFKSKKLIQNLI